ncbi:MAG: hypothetical protein SVY15_03040 [Halobacteriota archaeon]|nr:hypothetical protein [Halobacteriota archaeon]
MKKVYYDVKVMDISPGAFEGDGGGRPVDGYIVDGYVEVRLESGIQFWAFAEEDWRSSEWSLSLKGETISLTFSFLGLEIKLSEEKVKKLVPLPNRKKPCDYTLFGEVINKEPSPKLPEKFDRLQVDCGFVVNNISAEKDNYKIGDYIQVRGRLDAYLEVSQVNEKQGIDGKKESEGD